MWFFLVGHVQGRIVTGTESCIPQDQGSARVGVPALEVVEDLGGTLATTDNGDVVGLRLILQNIGESSAVLGRVHDTLILGETGRHFRLTTESHNDLARTARSDLTRLSIPRANNKVFNHAIGLFSGNDIDNLLTIGDNIIEALRTPAHIVLEFHARRQEGTQVGEVDKAILLVQIVQEGEAAAGIAEGSEILDEGDLHARSGDQHTGVPGELFLALKEADFRLEVGALGAAQRGVHRIVEGNANCQRGGTETDAEEIVHLVGGCRAQHGATRGGGVNVARLHFV